MRVIETLELIYFNQKKSSIRQQFNQTMLTLLTFLLWISPGFGNEKPSSCKPEDFEFCVSPCSLFRAKCDENMDCSLDLCSYWYPICHPQPNCPRVVPACWDLVSRCADEILPVESKNAYKRSILNKNFAYLLLKLHPFLNQTSQYGFLTSGRIRRITSNIGTEFLGKRSNTQSSRSSGRQTKPRTSTPSPPRFYSLPLNQFARTKVVKRDGDTWPRRIGVRGGGKVILGSEFLGKRAWAPGDGRARRLMGSELLGKRSPDALAGSELLGKRTGNPSSEFPGRRIEEDFLSGSELLGKKSRTDSVPEYPRLGRSLRENDEWPDYDPELIDEAFYNYRPLRNNKANGKGCERAGPGSGICERTKTKDGSSTEEQPVVDAD